MTSTEPVFNRDKNVLKYPTLQGFPLVYNGLVTNDTFDDDDDDTAVDEHNDTGSSHNNDQFNQDIMF